MDTLLFQQENTDHNIPLCGWTKALTTTLKMQLQARNWPMPV